MTHSYNQQLPHIPNSARVAAPYGLHDHESSSTPLRIHSKGKTVDDARIQIIKNWILNHLSSDHSVKALAARAAMSARHFRRLFQKETGFPPLKFIELARVKMARRLLEESKLPLKRVATYSGFTNANVMRAAFIRRVGVPPSLYRAQFHAKSPETDGTCF